MSLHRPALDKLLGLLRQSDTVSVAHFFRLGCSRDHVIHLVNLFLQRGIHFKALDLGIDTTTPAGKFMLSIFASLAEYDRESILEKTQRQTPPKAPAGGVELLAQKHRRPKGLSVILSSCCYKKA
jgi:DNA invertase Pin-like site-specific DNA recombinase